MHVEPVEIYADASNSAVIRHPGRRFPSVLVQGDALAMLCGSADRVCAQGRAQLDDDTYQDLNNLHSHLWSFLRHNTIVLGEHDIPLPFMDRPLPAEYKP